MTLSELEQNDFFFGSEVQLELKQESSKFPLVRTAKLVGFFDLDSQSFLPLRVNIFPKSGESLGEYFACVFRFNFGFGYWHVN